MLHDKISYSRSKMARYAIKPTVYLKFGRAYIFALKQQFNINIVAAVTDERKFTIFKIA